MQTILILVAVPWGDRVVSLVAVFLVGSMLVGIGEELYFRGIFRITVLDHHGELAALLLTSLAFGLAHTVKFIIEGCARLADFLRFECFGYPDFRFRFECFSAGQHGCRGAEPLGFV